MGSLFNLDRESLDRYRGWMQQVVTITLIYLLVTLLGGSQGTG